MLKGNQIFRIGIIILAISLTTSHSVGLSEVFTNFFLGAGCGLALVGTGKRFVEARTK